MSTAAAAAQAEHSRVLSGLPAALLAELANAERAQEQRVLATKAGPPAVTAPPAATSVSTAVVSSDLAFAFSANPFTFQTTFQASHVFLPVDMTSDLEIAEAAQLQRLLKKRSKSVKVSFASPALHVPEPFNPNPDYKSSVFSGSPDMGEPTILQYPQTEPIQLPNAILVEHVEVPAIHKGVLLKKSDWLGEWKLRTFVLAEGYLRYYDKNPESALRGQMPLTANLRVYTKDYPEGYTTDGTAALGAVCAMGASVMPVPITSRRRSFGDRFKKKRSGNKLDSMSMIILRSDTGERYLLKCESEVELLEWLEHLQMHLHYWISRE